jgi:hypothetical protein
VTSPDPNYDGLFNFSNLAGAIAAVPEIGRSPSLAASLANAPGDPVGNAQALQGTVQHTNAVKVVQHAQSSGLFGYLGHAISGLRTGVWDNIPGHDQVDTTAHGVTKLLAPLGTVANLANKPLTEVQHQYRFVRDVFDKHGAVAGIAELLAAAGVGAVGAYVGGAPGAKLAAEGELELAGHYGPFHDSWQRTQDGNTYRLGGHPVSPGRDVASLIGLTPGGNQTLQHYVDSIPILNLWLGDTIHHQDLYSVVSGAVDAGFDVAADPVLGVGQLATANRARTVITSADDFEKIATDSMKLHNGASAVISARGGISTSADRAYRMFKDVAKSDTGQIIEHYPTLRPLAPQLGPAKTVPDVIDVFRSNLATAELLGTKGIPSYSYTRLPARLLADKLRNITPTEVSDTASLAHKAAIFPANAVKQLSETIVRGASNRSPFAYDPVTREILTSGWDPSNPRAAAVLLRVVRLTESAEVARTVATRFAAETDPAKQFEIWQNAHAKVITHALAKRGVTDPKVVERVVADLTDHSGMGGAGRDSKYGYGPDGNPVDRIPAGDGTTGSPLWETQAGKLYTINPTTLTSIAQRLSNNPIVRAGGRIDDGLYNHIIAPLFKPQALLTGGFAFRNAGNEMLTRVIGGDGLSVLRAGVEKTAAKLNYRLSKMSPQVPDEVDHVTAALAEHEPHLLLKDPHLLDTTTRLILESDGHILPPGAQAGHAATGYGGDDLSDMKDNAARVIAAATGRGKAGVMLDPNNYVDYTTANGDKFGHALSGALSMVARDPAGPVMAKAFRDALDSGQNLETASHTGVEAGMTFLRDTERGQYQTRLIKSGTVSSTPDVDPLLDWSSRRMLALRGLVTGQNGEINQSLLDGLADHHLPVKGRTAGSLHPNLHADQIDLHPAETLPMKVAGMEIKNIQDVGAVQRIQNQGFSVLSGVINRLAREPIYAHHVDQEYQFAKTVAGLTDEEAWQLAKTRAVERMIPEIHNPLDRSQFALAARNFIPFFFAREQAYRRLAQAVIENPVGFRKVQLAGHAMKNIGWIHTDPQSGQDYFNYPLSGQITDHLPDVLNHLGIDTAVGVPGGFRGTIQGLYAGGESPDHLAGIGWSPVLSIPARGLASLDPQLAQLEAKAEGQVSASQSTISMFFPNSAVRSLMTAMVPAIQQRSFNNAQIDALQYAIARGDTPPNPTLPNGTPDPAYSAWIDRFHTHTRIMYGIKALFGIAAPSSPQLRQGSQQLSDLARTYISKYGLADGTRKLFADHPNMTSYEVFKTTATSGLPDTEKAVEWAAANGRFIDKFGKAATFFAPQPTTADPNVISARNAEIGLGLRARRTPDQYVHEVVNQTGWNEYQASKTARDAAIAAHPGDDAYAKQQYANFTDYLKTDLAKRNPVWYSEFQSLDAGTLAKQNIIEQTRAILTSKAFPKGSEPAAKIITGLLASYDTHTAALAGNGGSNGLSGAAAQSAERANWKAYLDSYIIDHPQAAVIVNRLFKGA